MRALLALAPVLLLTLQQGASPKAPATPPAPASAATPAPAAPAAASATKSFHSEAMHLSYSYPAGMQPADSMTSMMLDQQKAHATGDMKKELECMTIPFAGIDVAGGSPQMVMMFRADSGCLHLDLTAESLAQFTQGVSGGAAQIPGAKLSEPQAYKLGERAAVVMHGSLAIPNGGNIYMAVACTVNKPDILCWQMIAPSADGLAAIAASPVTFEGAAAMPVVPAGMLRTP